LIDGFAWVQEDPACRKMQPTSGWARRHSSRQGRQQRQLAKNGDNDKNALRRRPEFELPADAEGEIPDEFIPRM
jgi:hypothetical protein